MTQQQFSIEEKLHIVRQLISGKKYLSQMNCLQMQNQRLRGGISLNRKQFNTFKVLKHLALHKLLPLS
ncbi:hypothetical protein ccbrp13_31390 [Ktedonobacteria bacterium brp13]|nr:hypothetical protein ccbrp13_31390 [Ktedonobacteria bacterium brp13]